MKLKTRTPADSFDVSCPHCHTSLEVPAVYLAKEIKCPACGSPFVVETAEGQDTTAPSTASQATGRACVKCGANLGPGSTFCVGCGTDQKTGRTVASQLGSDSAPSAAVPRKPYRVLAMAAGVGILLAAIAVVVLVAVPRRGAADRSRAASPGSAAAGGNPTRKIAPARKPLPWVLPQGSTLTTAYVTSWHDTPRWRKRGVRDDPPAMVLVRKDTVAYTCLSREGERVYINGNEVASFSAPPATASRVVFSTDLQHWVATAPDPKVKFNGILLLDGEPFGPSMDGGFASPLISDDGRFVAAKVMSRTIKDGMFVNGTTEKDIRGNYILLGPKRTPVRETTSGWLLGNTKAADVTVPGGAPGCPVFKDEFFAIVGQRGNQHVWINGVEQWVSNNAARVEVDEVNALFDTGFHPASRMPVYVAIRGKENYFVFGGRTHGPFEAMRYWISANGAHYALRGDRSGRCVTIHDGKTLEYKNPIKPDATLHPTVGADLVLSPSGRHVAEVLGAEGQQFLVRDGIAVEVAERKQTGFESPSFTAPAEDLVYLFADYSTREHTRGERTLRAGRGQEFADADMGTHRTPAGTVAYDVRSEDARGLFLNGRVVIRSAQEFGPFRTVFFSEDGMHAACLRENGKGGAALFAEKWNSAVYDRIETSDGGVVFSPDGNRVAAVAHKGDEWTIVVDGKEGPFLKRADFGHGVYPRFSTDSRVCYYELTEAKTGGEVVFVAEGVVQDRYQKRVSDVITTPAGIVFYVLKGNAIHCVSYPKADR